MIQTDLMCSFRACHSAAESAGMLRCLRAQVRPHRPSPTTASASSAVGAGAARSPCAALAGSRHTIIYLPAPPSRSTASSRSADNPSPRRPGHRPPTR